MWGTVSRFVHTTVSAFFIVNVCGENAKLFIVTLCVSAFSLAVSVSVAFVAAFDVWLPGWSIVPICAINKDPAFITIAVAIVLSINYGYFSFLPPYFVLILNSQNQRYYKMKYANCLCVKSAFS